MWRCKAISRAVAALQPSICRGLEASTTVPESTWASGALEDRAWAALHTAARSLQESQAALPASRAARSSQVMSLGQPQHRTLASAVEAAEEPLQDIIMTDGAVQQLRALLRASTEGESILRLTVEAGGCSGFSYKFDLEKAPKRDDRVFTYDGVRLVTDELSFEFVRGAKIDYVDELIKAAFEVVENPNASGGCGCGSSFSPKM